jgi:hypothetical protein
MCISYGATPYSSKIEDAAKEIYFDEQHSIYKILLLAHHTTFNAEAASTILGLHLLNTKCHIPTNPLLCINQDNQSVILACNKISLKMGQALIEEIYNSAG